MEYGNAYLDDEEIQMEQRGQNVDDQHYIGHEAPQLQEDPHHGVVAEEELLAAQAAADAAVAQQQEHGTPGGVFSNVGQGLVGKNRDMMMQYWQEIINSIEHDEHDFKNHQLPLARIKKVMKTDEDVRMISAEAPILFAKGCDVFITELTMRAWIHAEENKRRTLQKSDIAAALTKSDMFDFLIDVVPREEERPKKAYRESAFQSSQLHHPMRQGMVQHVPPRNMSHLQNAHMPNPMPGAMPERPLPNQLPERSLQNSHGQSPSLQSDKMGGVPEPQQSIGSRLPLGDRSLSQGMPEVNENLENQNENEARESANKATPAMNKGIPSEQKDGPFFESYQSYDNEY